MANVNSCRGEGILLLGLLSMFFLGCANDAAIETPSDASDVEQVADAPQPLTAAPGSCKGWRACSLATGPIQGNGSASRCMAMAGCSYVNTSEYIYCNDALSSCGSGACDCSRFSLPGMCNAQYGCSWKTKISYYYSYSMRSPATRELVPGTTLGIWNAPGGGQYGNDVASCVLSDYSSSYGFSLQAVNKDSAEPLPVQGATVHNFGCSIAVSHGYTVSCCFN
jgi:hypothetical protein